MYIPTDRRLNITALCNWLSKCLPCQAAQIQSLCALNYAALRRRRITVQSNASQSKETVSIGPGHFPYEIAEDYRAYNLASKSCYCSLSTPMVQSLTTLGSTRRTCNVVLTILRGWNGNGINSGVRCVTHFAAAPRRSFSRTRRAAPKCSVSA